MRNILIVPTTFIGDTILLSGSIDYLRSEFPTAKITITVNENTQMLLGSFPGPVDLISFPRERYNVHWLKLFNRLRGTAWDGILDLRGSVLGLFLRYRKIWTLPRMQAHMHKSELSNIIFNKTLVPKIWPKHPDEWQHKKMPGNLLWITFGIGASQISRNWPTERFIAIADRLLANDKKVGIVLLAAPYTRKLVSESQLNQLMTRYPGRIVDALGSYDFEAALGFLQLSNLVVTVDSAPLHIAAALNKPLLALFGPTAESMSGPIKQQPSSVHHILRAMPPISWSAHRSMDHQSYSEQMLAIKETVVLDKIIDVLSSLRNKGAAPTTNKS